MASEVVPCLVPNPAAVASQGFLFLLAQNCRMLPSKASNFSNSTNPSKASNSSKRAKPALGAAKRRTLKGAKPALGVSRTGSCGKRSGPLSSAKPSGCGKPRLSCSTGPKLPDAPFKSLKPFKPFKSLKPLETCQTGSWSCETTDLETCQTGSWSKPNKRSGPLSSAKPSGCGKPRLSCSTGPKLPDAPFKSLKPFKPFKSLKPLETCQTGSWSCETTDLETCQTGSWSKPNKRSGPLSSAKPSGCGKPRLSFSTGPKLPDAPFKSLKPFKPFKSLKPLETCQTGSWSCETTDLETCQTSSWSKPNWKLWQAKWFLV